MKKFILLAFLVLFLLPMNVKAIGTSAECAILMDMDQKTVLYSQNIHEVRPVASISKIMTALLAVESGKLNETVTVGDEILKSYGSGIYIQVGEHLTLKDLTYGLMLRSGNDASYAIAKYVGGSVEQFVQMMNEKAKQIGMKNTIFHNPNGLDDDGGNLSTAYDMAILTSYAMKLDDYKTIVGTKVYKLKTDKNTYHWPNKNKLLNIYKYTTGGKTGFTDVAKRTLVSTASKDNFNLVVVTLNDGNDWEDHQTLFNYAFDNYETVEILKKGPIHILDDTYYEGKELYIENEFRYSFPKGEQQNVVLKFSLEKKNNPADKEIVGKVRVIRGDEQLYETDILVHNNKTKIGFWQRIADWFRNLW